MKQILLYFFLLLGAGKLYAQTFVIPDSNFFNAILTLNVCRNASNVSVNCSTCVVNYTTRELNTACIDGLNITTLDVNGKSISDLSGIEYFVDLSGLLCYDNQLTSLPNTLPNNLKSLDCSNNQLTNLPNTLLNNLKSLDCSNNQLTSLPNTLPNNLQTLNCSNNQLTNLPVSLPDSLRNLLCSHNQLTNLPNTLPNNLTLLYCTNNQLTSLPVSLPDSLRFLECSHNQLTNIDVINYHGLVGLGCSHNQIDSLPNIIFNVGLIDNTDVTSFDCSHNQIQHISHIYFSHTIPDPVYYIDLSYNLLKELPITIQSSLPPYTFTFNISHNQIEVVEPYIVRWLSANFLDDFDCSYNSIEIFCDSLLANSINASHNQINFIPPSVEGQKLNFSNNPLSNIVKLNIPVNKLNIDSTYITCLPTLPYTLDTLLCVGSPLYCLPRIIGISTPPLIVCGNNSPCTNLHSDNEAEVFPPTSVRQIIHDTLYLPFTSPTIDIIDYEIAVYNKTPTQKDTLAVFGGDIVLGKPQQMNALYGISSPITTWQGKIPYNPVGISDSIRRAIQYFNVRAGLMGLRIAFVPKQPTDIDFVTFRHSPGSFASYVGKIGGEQYIWVDTAGFTGKILHEMTHTLGMYHEHQRDSAQFYVNIQNQYIRTAFADAFCRVKDIQTTPYDYNSLMHYVCFAFSKFPPLDGVNLALTQNTLLATQNTLDAEMGQRSDYSSYDIADINQLYPDGIVGGIGFTGTGIFRLLIDTTNVASIAWSVYNTEPLVFAGNTYNIDVTATNVNGSMTKAAITTPFPINAPRAARGFVVATVTFTNGQQKKFYKYVYRN